MARWLLVFAALAGCHQSKRERCIQSENHVADIVVEYWLARPDQWCRDSGGSAADDAATVAECAAHLTTAEGRAALDRFARIGTSGPGLDVCVNTYKDAFIECRLDARTFEGIGTCDHLQR